MKTSKIITDRATVHDRVGASPVTVSRESLQVTERVITSGHGSKFTYLMGDVHQAPGQHGCDRKSRTGSRVDKKEALIPAAQ